MKNNKNCENGKFCGRKFAIAAQKTTMTDYSTKPNQIF